MAFDTRPVTPDRVDDFAAVANPNRRPSHCWCLSHRLSAREITELGGGSREAAFRALCARENPPGVIGYVDGKGQSTPVRSPFGGKLMGLLAHAGERVREGQPVAWLRSAQI